MTDRGDAGAAADLELEVKHMIVRAARLTATKAQDIDPEAALFDEGLGLDSLDAIQIATALESDYGVSLSSDDEENRRLLGSVRSIAQLIRRSGALPTGTVGKLVGGGP